MTHTYTQKSILFFICLSLAGGILFSLATLAHAREQGETRTRVHASTTAEKRAFKKIKENRIKERRSGDRTASTTSGSGKGKNVDASCMQTAINAREESIVDAWETFATDMTEALTARASALDTAWASSETSTRNTLLKSLWKEWSTSSKEAHKSMKDARKESWDTFRATAKSTCKIELPKEEKLNDDSTGSIAL